MTKGIMSLFVAAIALLGVTSASATAPVISTIPDVIIGDAENNGPSDNNFFVFTDAFTFDDKVEDDLTADASLKWSFDEGDDPPLFNTATNWYTINGKSPVHVGTAAAAGDTSSTADHVNPPLANELRVTSNTASFRDIVFSPGPGTGPFGDPTEPNETNHATGKVVTFYVSDGTYAASKDILVKTIDNGFDALTSDAAYEPFIDDLFNSNGTGSTWVTGGSTSTNTGLNNFNYDAGTGSYRIIVNSTGTGTAARYRFAYWNNQRADWLPYSAVGSEKYVRAKYYLYNTGSNTASNTLGQYNVPNFNVKLMQRFAITGEIMVQTHDSIAGDLPFYKELAPNTNPAVPSLYRVDFDPIDVPYMRTASAIGNPQPEEGIQSGFEIFALFPEDNGTIAMTEREIGTYPISALGTVKQSQLYDSTLLTHANSTALDVNDLINPTGVSSTNGEFPPKTPGAGGTMTVAGGAVTFNTTSVAADRIGNLERTFFAGSVQANRFRIAENEQYVIRYHLTSTAPTSTQGSIWLKARTAKFGWTYFLQLAGGGTSGAGRFIAREALPGVGSLNPDKISSENGGWYTLVMPTPLDGDIRPETAGSIATKMPNLGNPALPGRGVEATSSYRDVRVEVIVYDTLSSPDVAANAEAVVLTVDQIDLKAYDRIAD